MIDESTFGFSKPDAEDLLQLIGGGDSEIEDTRPPSPNNQTRFYVYEITSIYSSNECVATIDTLAGVEVETGATVVDPTGGSFSNAPTTAKGICIKEGGVYYALGPYVTTVDWSSPNLTYNKGGGAGINVDTAEDC